MLNDSQLKHLREEGYLRLGRVMSEGQLAALQQRVDDLTQGRIRNEKIGFQLEPAARKRMGKPKTYEWYGPSLSYRKLPHMDQDPLFLEYFSHPTFCSIMRQLIGPELFIFRAFGLLKPAHDGSPLDWHQDIDGANPDAEARGHYYTVWTAIDGADAENGALAILSGSHRHSKLKEEEKEQLVEEMAGREELLIAKPGDAFLLDQFLLHSSGPNPTSWHRRAVTLIYHDARIQAEPRDPPYTHIDMGAERLLQV